MHNTILYYKLKPNNKNIAEQRLYANFIQHNGMLSNCFWEIIIWYQLRTMNPQTLLKLLIKGKGVCL